MRRALVTSLAFAVFAGLAQPASAVPADVRAAVVSDAEPTAPRPMPPDPYREWDGTAGVPLWGDPRFRQIVADNAELAEDVEVREAATAALAAGGPAIMVFLDTGLDAAKKKADERKAETARRNRAAIEPLRGTGGPYLKAEVERVLAGTDVDRAQFLAYGRRIAEQRDAESGQTAQQRADENRARVQMLVGAGGPEVRKAAQLALAAGDAAIAEFLKSGYLTAAKADADAREQYLKDQEARDKAAEALSDLAKRSARANEARRNLLVAHGNGVRALERSANALISAAAEARKAAQILAANKAGGQHPVNAFDEVKTEVARQLGYARQAASDAQQASASAQVQANVLVETGLTYGTQWAQMAAGMADAARAAVSASETAQHAIDATAFTDQARNAQEEAERHAEEARQWRLHAEEHARAAGRIAEAARVQAEAAKDAAARTKTARQAAEAAEAQAWAAAERTRAARLTAEKEAAKAAAARATAERERANAAAARGRAEQQASVARAMRGEAEFQASIAAGARQHAEQQDGIAAGAETGARNEERNAAQARDRAYQAERDQRAAEARAAAMDAMAAASRGSGHETEARDAAAQAHVDADVAKGAAGAARGAANTATGAAAGARAAATEATRAAARARAAAQQAAAAAARANAAANKAEAEAAATHAAAQRSNSAAADATASESQAAEAARSAVELAERAASEAVQSLRSAERTREESDAASAEAVSAATQAKLAVEASLAARASSQAITDPANTAIRVVAPFSGADIDADFVILVANQAKAVGAEQAAAAQQRAAEALEASRLAAEAASRAAAEVKPAFDAAAAAAKSSADAARSAAEAQQAAAEAAADGAAARAAAARANQADAQARQDAILAWKAANAANSDAAIAGRAASAAENDAAAARSAASRAEADAAAARGAADRAETDAAAAQTAADSAQHHADNAAVAAKNAMNSAIDAGKAADRAEEAARKAAEEKRKQDAANSDGVTVPPLSAEDEAEILEMGGQAALDEYRQAVADAKKGIIDWLIENGGQVLLDVIGVTDAKKCFGEGDVAACLWTVVNVGSLLVLVAKLPAVSAAIGKVAAGLVKFLEASAAGRKVLEKFDKFMDWVRRAKTCKCFPAGTPIATADGEKPIERIALGDQVWAKDLRTGRSQQRKVIGLFQRHADELLTIVAGTTTLEVTRQHPFWVPGRGWTEAGALRPGDELLSRTGDRPVIATITARTVSTTVYNFEVEGDHNYYITDAQLLVHNCDIAEQAWNLNNTEQKLTHVIDAEKHGFADLVAKAGGREQALKRIVDSLHTIDDLPASGAFEVLRTIEGEVVTIRGAVVNGIPRLGTAFIAGKFPGG
ncbi:intein C-terminal splicing region/intein N-terminal splicing region [Amycolatopsis xylanica]|uniref:Intein C-terminal splicing region/intein N-terminal splicing region n=1 Tax=Amycolatopsis xylanica TaxID=589385 RepID=A0A1H3IKS2_9PSEU|nr:polymorphic toxin-type HINT domain-containing protein [Amycolatopsis xylanica]SDY28376.1 intein C-terminal splicing region/intein N-terminal splicing region [Amycolatopsis xylanica]